jgi:hypothetical protein
MQLAPGAVRADLGFEGAEGVCLRCKDWHGLKGFHEFRRFQGFAFSGCSFPDAPFGFATEAIDTELAEELEMGAELISGHD